MLIVDTGVLVAATDRTDPHHDASAEILSIETQPLVTSAMVIAETAYLLDCALAVVVAAEDGDLAAAPGSPSAAM